MNVELPDPITTLQNAPRTIEPSAALPLPQTALEALPFPVSIFARDGLYVGDNALVEQLFQVPKEAVVGTFNFLNDPRSQATSTVFHAAVAGTVAQAPGIFYDFSFPGTRRTSRTRCFLESTYFPIRNDAGEVAHVGVIYQDGTERAEAEQRLQTFVNLTENATDGVGAADGDGRLTYANAAYQHMTGYGSTLVGMRLNALFVEDAGQLADAFTALATHGAWRGRLTIRRADGSTFPAAISAFALHEAAGGRQGSGAIIRDLTADVQAEQERLVLQEQVIEAQRAALRELSTPLIPVADDVVVMPLIGTLDSARAMQVIETLLAGVSELRARIAILDITGVSVVDTQVANGLIRAAQAVRLLGAQVILTGIRPEVAQTLVQLGVDLTGIVTRGSLKDGIAYALGTMLVQR